MGGWECTGAPLSLDVGVTDLACKRGTPGLPGHCLPVFGYTVTIQKGQQQPFLEAPLHAVPSMRNLHVRHLKHSFRGRWGPHFTGEESGAQRNHGSYLLLRQETEPGFSAQTPVPWHCRAGCPTRGRWEAPRSLVTERCVCYLREGPQRRPVTANGFRLSWRVCVQSGSLTSHSGGRQPGPYNL